MLKQDPNINLVGLFTTVNKQFGRVAIHGTRIELLKQQSSQIGLPLDLIEIPFPCSNADYEKIMAEFITKIQADNIEAVAFRDLYLEDIRKIFAIIVLSKCRIRVLNQYSLAGELTRLSYLR